MMPARKPVMQLGVWVWRSRTCIILKVLRCIKAYLFKIFTHFSSDNNDEKSSFFPFLTKKHLSFDIDQIIKSYYLFKSRLYLFTCTLKS